MTQNQDDPTKKTILVSDIKLHCVYLGIIVSLFFIWIITLRLAANKEAVDYISFASTLASLLLAIIAIYIGLTGNATLWSILGGARELFQKSLETQEFISESGKTNVQTAELLATQVNQLAVVVNERHGSIDARLQQLQSSFGEQISANTRQPQPPIQEPNTRAAVFSAYISWTSNHGLMIAYVITRIAGSNVSYDRKRFGEIYPPLGGEYAQGIIVASISANIFSVVPQKTNEPYLFLQMPEDAIGVVETALQSRLYRDREIMPAVAVENLAVLKRLKVELDIDLQKNDRRSFTLDPQSSLT